MATVLNLTAGGGVSLDKLRPVGSLYQSVVNTDPGLLFGGTWTRYGKGRVAVGLHTGDAAFGTVGKTGGAKTHALSIAEMGLHKHTLTVKAATLPANPAHGHSMPSRPSGRLGMHGINIASPGGTWTGDYVSTDGAHTHTITPKGSIGNAGSGAAHNNLMPFFTAFAWKRVA